MTKQAKAKVVRQTRLDMRVCVPMRCKDCGGAWFENKMPEDKTVFLRCSRCATLLWARWIAEQERDLGDKAYIGFTPPVTKADLVKMFPMHEPPPSGLTRR